MATLIERAFQLAAAGKYKSLTEVRSALKGEGYTQIDHHLSGSSIRNQLRKLMLESAAG